MTGAPTIAAALAARLPPSLATYGTRVAVGPCGEGACPAASLRDPATLDGILARFGAAYAAKGAPPDRRSLVSLWSQSYLAALIIPSATALLCLGRALPVAFEAVAFELDGAHTLARFLIPAEAPAGEGGFSTLVSGHLDPFIGLCAARTGVSPRALWGNAGVMLDFTLRELAAAGPLLPGPAAEAAALLGRPPCAAHACPLARTFRIPGAGAGCPRRVCCLRYRLPGVPSCGALCPTHHKTDKPC
ncbi:MAG: siderophore-iron reductase FhuF [Methylobacterium frigidaeris]